MKRGTLFCSSGCLVGISASTLLMMPQSYKKNSVKQTKCRNKRFAGGLFLVKRMWKLGWKHAFHGTKQVSLINKVD